MDNNADNICFFIAPIGEPGTPAREHSDLVLRHIVQPAASRFGYVALRADQIERPGIITSQVIERVVESPMVVADLTGHNPNVFYELAIRHALRKPYVQIIKNGETIPFDVATARTVFFDLDLDGAASATNEVARQIESLRQDPSDLETPISVTIDLQSLRRTPGTSDVGVSQLLPLLEDINSAVHNNSNAFVRLHEMGLGLGTTNSNTWNPGVHRTVVRMNSPYGFIASIGSMRSTYPWIYELCTAAYSRVLDGDIRAANALFNEATTLMNTRFPNSSDFVQTIAPELRTLFDRLVETVLADSSAQTDELPF